MRENGSWEARLKFFLQGIYEVSQEATETSRKIVDLREAHRKLIAKHFGRVVGNASQLMNKFVDHGLLTGRPARHATASFVMAPVSICLIK